MSSQSVRPESTRLVPKPVEESPHFIRSNFNQMIQRNFVEHRAKCHPTPTSPHVTDASSNTENHPHRLAQSEPLPVQPPLRHNRAAFCLWDSRRLWPKRSSGLGVRRTANGTERGRKEDYGLRPPPRPRFQRFQVCLCANRRESRDRRLGQRNGSRQHERWRGTAENTGWEVIVEAS